MKEKNIKDLIERTSNYDNHKELNGAFDGHQRKSAVRIDDDTKSLKQKRTDNAFNVKKTPKDSLFFGDLFRALMSKKSYYKTYLNELFNEKNKSDMYIPGMVSCIVKHSENHSDCQLEVIGSRLANLFGIDTVYNIAVESAVQDEYDDYPEYDAIVSVDCIPYGYRMETFKDLYLDFTEDTMLDEIFYMLDNELICLANEKNFKITQETIEAIKRKFAEMFLFRNLVCEDFDFCDRNTALFLGENGEIELAPCFDMGLLFRGKKSHTYYDMFARNTIKCMQETMPEVLKSFMDRYKQIVNGENLEKVVKNSIKVNPMYTTPIYEQILENYDRLKTIILERENDCEMLDE